MSNPEKLIAVILIIIFSIPINALLYASNANKSVEFFRSGNIDEAIEYFENELTNFLPSAEESEIRMYLSFFYISKSDTTNSFDYLFEALILNPFLELPENVSTECIELFYLAKSQMIKTLHIHSIPKGAEVYFDDQFIGQTPVEINGIKVATYHKFELIIDGFFPTIITMRIDENILNNHYFALRELTFVVIEEPKRSNKSKIILAGAALLGLLGLLFLFLKSDSGDAPDLPGPPDPP